MSEIAAASWASEFTACEIGLRSVRAELQHSAFQFHYEIYRFRGNQVDLLGRLSGVFEFAGFHNRAIIGEEVALAIKGELVAQFIRRSGESEGWCKGASPFSCSNTTESTLATLENERERTFHFEQRPGGVFALRDFVHEARDRFGRSLFTFHAFARIRKRLSPGGLLEFLNLRPLTIGVRSDWVGQPFLAGPEIEKLAVLPDGQRPLLVFGALRDTAEREMEWAHGYRAGAGT